jgi:hypothetical protein
MSGEYRNRKEKGKRQKAKAEEKKIVGSGRR